jgi:hypothetical protein
MDCQEVGGKFLNYEDDYDEIQAMCLGYFTKLYMEVPSKNREGSTIYGVEDMEECGRYFNVNGTLPLAWRKGDIFSISYNKKVYIFMINDEKEIILVRDDCYCRYQEELEINLNGKIYNILRTYKLLNKRCSKLL